MSVEAASQAINQSLARFDQAAARVARGPSMEGFVSAAVEMKSAQLDTEAAVAVMKAVDENLGTLLDELA
jgi:hypothetical protein